ncbi:general transcription factor II-I repeat domain-containing protein 2-like [Xenopus laevis]|uniref:General transcription factor II-I repeat domain-containing protein 2-like n=1 Tax=Xenopus laevis TaxID=8355 RepID=A0A8J1MKL3_XENLA|nr:general transcription factor II-I repeat domain-containing protein 2-like [Xenopus laevis]XP_041442019.1 general transcription factor II-I repeat domain-containing protein 2-like [Xenopus laevis]XP_041442020.1 general transcription factor II-I repeat domain-containing protein 2-like [Xenopus laevis]XP_041442021.1 general transcription factor II-I repeat domain-containing protein 2-like [Xenopus laevis]XP_041442022.1 general transcription factor II-I repeat domain-containing protein 2-like [X
MAFRISESKKEHRKRKVTEEGRVFKENWTEEYFFVEANSKALCLICGEYVQVFKDYNLKRHYMQKHAAKFSVYQGMCRKDKAMELKKSLSSQQNFFKKVITQTESIVKASYVVTYLIAKKSKPFTDGEFIKQCMESVADIICPEKKGDISKISLSHQTIARRTEDIGKSVERCLKSKAAKFKYYALAVDESTDATDTAPKNMLNRYSLSFVNISGIVTDGAPAMVGRREGLVKLIENDAIAAKNSHLMKYHCIVHPENLCAKALKMDNIMQIVIKAVNFIRAKGLNHRQFQEFLRSIDADCGDVIYFSEVRWLSRGQMLKRFYDLRHEVKSFMVSKAKCVPELDDENWLTGLAFLVDLTSHLNDLNMRLQGKNQLINTMFQGITAFQTKLKLWEDQIKANNFMHFNTLAKHVPVNTEKYAALLYDLIQEFEKRFQDFRENKQHFAIFATPFSVDINMLPANFQMECIELQSDFQLKEKFDHVSLLDFYRSYLPRDKYPSLHNHALFLSSLFGSTYICEQLFSRMKHTKSKIRTKLSDEHLEYSLRIATTSNLMHQYLVPLSSSLSSQVECQKFH